MMICVMRQVGIVHLSERGRYRYWGACAYVPRLNFRCVACNFETAACI